MTAAEFTAIAIGLINTRNANDTGATMGRTASQNRDDLAPGKLDHAFIGLQQNPAGDTTPSQVIARVTKALLSVGIDLT